MDKTLNYRKNKKIAIATLGCRLNQFESDCIVTDFVNAGYKIVLPSDVADAYIINTCTVTGKSDAKSRNLIRKVNKKNPNALLIVIGCYAETNKEEIEQMHGVDYAIGNDKKANIFKLVDNIFSRETLESYSYSDIPSYKTNDKSLKEKLSSIIESNSFDYTAPTDGKHTRCFLKIQDGCDVKCTYCKVPYARGSSRSRKVNDILEEINHLYQEGFKEFILTGINIGYYDDNGNKLEHLIEAIYRIEGDFRIRISSIEPDKITDNLIKLFNHNKMGHHLHIPLQSGSNKILKAMRRHYDREFYINLINKIRNTYPNINITTDLMIGFPSETEEDFEFNKDIIKRCKFTHIHTFKYSKREGTLASKMPNQVDEILKTRWSEEVRRISINQNEEYRKKQIGKIFRVLIEEHKSQTIATGFTDNYIKVIIPDCDIPKGEFVNVKIEQALGNRTIATLCK